MWPGACGLCSYAGTCERFRLCEAVDRFRRCMQVPKILAHEKPTNRNGLFGMFVMVAWGACDSSGSVLTRKVLIAREGKRTAALQATGWLRTVSGVTGAGLGVQTAGVADFCIVPLPDFHTAGYCHPHCLHVRCISFARCAVRVIINASQCRSVAQVRVGGPTEEKKAIGGVMSKLPTFDMEKLLALDADEFAAIARDADIALVANGKMSLLAGEGALGWSWLWCMGLMSVRHVANTSMRRPTMYIDVFVLAGHAHCTHCHRAA